MEALTKLRNTVSSTFSSTVQNTAYGLSQLSSVLPGNPVTREFEATAHIASAGPGLLWKVYSGYKKSTKQEASIFVFEKRTLERWNSKGDRELILETLRHGATQLTKLRHPQILIVQHPLEESRDSLAFATEPVLASLSNVLGNHDNLPARLPAALVDYKLHDVETRYGLLQLGEGLAFLHGDVKLLHRNLCPESIVINSHGAWKIFGFDFCVLNQSSDGKQPMWPPAVYDSTLPAVIRPQLEYQAPESVIASSVTPASDIFSIGMLAYVLYAPNNVPLAESKLSTSQFPAVPETLRDTIKLMLNRNPELRPDAHQFIKIEYFMDIGVKTLNYLDKIFQWDNLQKSQFYKGLPQLLKQLPHRVTLHRVLPALYKELVNSQMIPFVLPSILYAMGTSSVEEFREHILPNIKPVLLLDDPPQIRLVLMQHIDLLLKLCTSEVIKMDVVPMLLRALESDWEQLQELCLSALPNIITLIDGPVIKNAILPRMKKICLHGQGNKSLSVRVNSLLCLAKMLPNFDRWLVFDEVLPFLQEVPHGGEPAILMAIIGIYRILLNHSKLGVSKEILARKILPFLLPLCIEQNFSPSQYNILTSMVLEMINRVVVEHKEALKQLDAVRKETQQLSDQALSPSIYTNDNSAIGDVDAISMPSFTSQNPMRVTNDLTMDDKLRLIQQQEAHQRLQSLAPLTPKTVQQPAKSRPRDLTDTLLKSNLDQLNLSMLTPQKQDYSWRPPNSGQPQFFNQQATTTSPLGPKTNAWSPPNQSMWNPITPQSTVNSPMNLAAGFPSSFNSSQKVENTPTQDIMDLLS